MASPRGRPAPTRPAARPGKAMGRGAPKGRMGGRGAGKMRAAKAPKMRGPKMKAPKMRGGGKLGMIMMAADVGSMALDVATTAAANSRR